MSEAKYKRTQTATVDLGAGFAKITVIVEYDKPKLADPLLKRVDNFVKYCDEYPNAQLDLLKNNLTTIPAGDSRTDSYAAELRKSQPKQKAPTKKASKAGREKVDIDKKAVTGRQRGSRRGATA